jgi:hypothetical protein
MPNGARKGLAQRRQPWFFRLKEPSAIFLKGEAVKSNKTMTAIAEELLSYRKQFKSWPNIT